MARENIYLYNRVVYLSDDFDNETVGKINAYLINLILQDDKEDNTQKNYKREPIHIYISSRGGGAYDALGLMQTILSSKTPIYTYVKGYAMSAGFWLFICGHKRFIGKYDTILYHQLHCNRSGKYQDLVEDRVQMDWLQNTLENIIIEHTKITKEKLLEIKEKKIDWCIHCDEAIALGCADEKY